MNSMRKLLLVCLLGLLALPAAALGARNAPGDGTLSVKGGNGTVVLAMRGGLILRCGRCTVTIDDPVSGDGSGAIAFGADIVRPLDETKTLYKNDNKGDMRIRIIGGFFSARVNGAGINLSAVGKGTVVMWANPLTDEPGTYALDDADPLPVPYLRVKLPLGVTG